MKTVLKMIVLLLSQEVYWRSLRFALTGLGIIKDSQLAIDSRMDFGRLCFSISPREFRG
jgi:hypothetical protein